VVGRPRPVAKSTHICLVAPLTLKFCKQATPLRDTLTSAAFSCKTAAQM